MELIGKGSFSRVYKAYDELTLTTLAIKEIIKAKYIVVSN